MNYTDLINGLFELVAGCLSLMNVRKLYVDKQVKGVSIAPVAFFTTWGLYNMFFYPHNGLMLSFWGGVVMTIVNLIWVGQMVYYSKKLEWKNLIKLHESVYSKRTSWPVYPIKPRNGSLRIIDWYQSVVDDELRSRLMFNIDDDSREFERSTLNGAISSGFVWCSSPEEENGENYWEPIFYKAIKNEIETL